MSKTYYDFPDTSYPPITLAVLERLRLYFCTYLYPDEEYAVSKTKFLLSDISPNMALRESVKSFNISNATFPFTAYSIGEAELDTLRENSFAKTTNYYSSTHSAKINAVALVQEFPMISFFTTAKDYNRARTVLTKEAALPTKLTTPITINGTLTSFVIYVDFFPQKGSYSFKFEQQLTAGNIYDVMHTARVNYHQIVVDAEVAPVDDIITSLKELDTLYLATKIQYGDSEYSPATPTISSTDPADEEVDVEVDSSIIINFSVPMVEQVVEDSFSILPAVDADFVWNTGSTQMIVDVYTDLVSGTNYEVTIEDTAKSGNNVPISEDYEFEFTTV